MSAFVCTPKHVGVVAHSLVERYHGSDESAGEFAEAMAKVNLESVAHHYGMSSVQASKEFAGLTRKEYIRQCREAADTKSNEFSEERLWGLASCYLYQSCESDTCVNSATYQTVLKMEVVLENVCQSQGIRRDGWSLRE